MPARCPASCRVVIGYPFSGNVGTYRWTGASRSSFPCSYSRATAAAVSGFDTLPMRNCVSRVTGRRRAASAYPNPSDHATVPSIATATCTPGMRGASRSHTSARIRATVSRYAAGTLPDGRDRQGADWAGPATTNATAISTPIEGLSSSWNSQCKVGKTFYAKGRRKWRAWLARHHKIWLIYESYRRICIGCIAAAEADTITTVLRIGHAQLP